VRKFFLLLILLFLKISLPAQTLRKLVAASYLGLGAYSINHIDAFSFTSNQASLAQINFATAAVYAERRFLLSALNNYTAAIGLHTNSGNFGLKANYYGFSDYNETQLGLAYGRKLGNKVDIGAQFNYYSIRIPTYGNASTISFELGAILHVTDKLHAGIHVANPVGGKFGEKQQEKLSSVYSMGLGYDASEKFFVSMEIEKEEDQPVNINAGVQYRFAKQLFARAGISSASSTPYCGVGISWSNLRIDISGSYHPQLGWSPGLLLILNTEPLSPKGSGTLTNQ